MLKNEEKAKILLVEDDDIVVKYLTLFFHKNGYKVISIESGEYIATILDKHRIKLVILDIGLPGKNGFYWLKWLRNYHSHIPVIISTINSGKIDRLKGFELGAIDYIPKPFIDKEVLLRVKNILGHSYQSRYLNIGNFTFDIRNNSISKNGREKVILTALEADIFKLLYLNAGTVLTRDDINEQIRGVKHNPLDRSIDIHINNIRKKIEDVPSKPQYIHTVRGKGYRLTTTSSFLESQIT
jgi:DNA-binding response OmpR family regulator